MGDAGRRWCSVDRSETQPTQPTQPTQTYHLVRPREQAVARRQDAKLVLAVGEEATSAVAAVACLFPMATEPLQTGRERRGMGGEGYGRGGVWAAAWGERV